MDDAEFEAGLDLDPPVMSRGVGTRLPGSASSTRRMLAPVAPGAAVEAIGTAEALHHPGLDMPLFGMADVLGEGVVADDRAVLVPALRGSKVHAHAYSVSRTASRSKSANSCAYSFWRQKRIFGAKKATKSMPHDFRAGLNVSPTVNSGLLDALG